MAKIIVCLALITIATISIVHGSGLGAQVLCGGNDWVPFEDEKCVKLFRTFKNRHDAEISCNQEDATLVAIRSAAEQKFLTQMVFNITNPVWIWIGAQRGPDSETEYYWNDGSSVHRFTNWAVGYPLPIAEKSCVMLQTEWSRPFSISDLEWSNAACTDGGHYLCEKLQSWPTEYLQTAILSARRNKEDYVYSFSDQLSDVTAKLNDAKTELKYIRENPVPINFVYTQLPDQPEPWRIWWNLEWTEVTEQYAGLFFRAEGGGSAQYGTIQEDNSPRLRSVNGRQTMTSAVTTVSVPVNGGTTPLVSAGATGAATHWGLSFVLSTGEVRPRNTAVRIWMRTN